MMTLNKLVLIFPITTGPPKWGTTYTYGYNSYLDHRIWM
uniref:Uncharacterized protein n=1 Tax=Anguilla anguilla TaxID=7936 RepID=A0A0E9RJF0_ANGAN